MLAGVPLRQFAEPAAPRPPAMHVLNPARTRLPHAGLDHPPAQRFFSDLNLVMFGQLLGSKRRPEIVPVRLTQDRQRLLLRFRGQLAVGGLSTQLMNYHGIPLFLHPPQQLPHPALGHSHPLGSFPLRHLPVPRSFQPVQPVLLLLAHRDSFHPSALRLSIGTFYLAQLGTSYLAATVHNP